MFSTFGPNSDCRRYGCTSTTSTTPTTGKYRRRRRCQRGRGAAAGGGAAGPVLALMGERSWDGVTAGAWVADPSIVAERLPGGQAREMELRRNRGTSAAGRRPAA